MGLRSSFIRRTLLPPGFCFVVAVVLSGCISQDSDRREEPAASPEAPETTAEPSNASARGNAITVGFLAQQALTVANVDTESGESLWQTVIQLGGPHEPAFATQGGDFYVVLGSEVRRITRASGDTARIYSAPGPILDLAISEDRKMAMSVAPRDGCRPFAGECQGIDNGGIVIADASTGDELETLITSDQPLASLDGGPFRLAWVDTDSLAIETTSFDAAGGDTIAVLKLRDHEVAEVALQSPVLFGPAASLVAGRPGGDPVGCAGESRLSLLSLPSGDEVASISIDGADLSADAWSPDGSQLLLRATLWAPPPKPGSCPQVVDEVQYYVAAADGTTTKVDDLDRLLEEWYGRQHVRWDCTDEERSSLRPDVRRFLCFGETGTLSLGNGAEVATASSVWVIY